MNFSKMDKWELFATIIKAVTAVATTAVVLEENHPYITLIILMLGAAANEYLMYMHKRQVEIEKQKNETNSSNDGDGSNSDKESV